MSTSLNKILLSIPLYQMNFITPFPDEEVFFEHISRSLANEVFEQPTIVVVDTNDDWLKLNEKETANQLIQQPNLQAIILYNKTKTPLQENIRLLYKECFIPLIQIEDLDSLKIFFEPATSLYTYSNLSIELDGFYKKGFMEIATNLAMAFSTPLVFLDENGQLLWQTGAESEVRKCLESFSSGNTDKNMQFGLHESSVEPPGSTYVQYPINISGQTEMFLISLANLSAWQKSILDKFIGFTAVLFQTDEVVREQNDRFKEFFIYELIYRKFESKKVLIDQGKTLGWNLEKPHHLFVLEIELPQPHPDVTELLEEVIFQLEYKKAEINKAIHVFPFQDHIVALVEDTKDRTPSERKNITIQIGEWLQEQVLQTFPQSLLHIGIGKWYDDTIHLNKSYQEAKVAIQFGKLWFRDMQIFHMHDLGVLHLLTNIHRELLDDFCQQYLSPLIKSDQEDTEHLLTLKTYFQYDGVINRVAEALFVHPNTLRKRLKRIEEMTGIDMQNMEEMLTLMVAIKIYYSFSF